MVFLSLHSHTYIQIPNAQTPRYALHTWKFRTGEGGTIMLGWDRRNIVCQEMIVIEPETWKNGNVDVFTLLYS